MMMIVAMRRMETVAHFVDFWLCRHHEMMTTTTMRHCYCC
jgi:hypothetical protein